MNTEAIKAAVIKYGMNFIWAVVILVAGRYVVKLAAAVIGKAMRKTKVDETVEKFCVSLTSFIGMIFVIVATLAKLGVQTASIVAAVGAIGLAIGLAMQGSLSNFASGILIITFRPFKVGDLVKIAGEVGTVREIDMFTTKIITPDNKTMIIPNSILTADTITNLTETEDLRLDLVFGAGYDDDIDKVKGILQKLVSEDERILKTPEPLIGVLEHADSSINYAVRPWVKAKDFWAVYFSLNEKVKKAFDAEEVSIPYPQRDIHIVSQPD